MLKEEDIRCSLEPILADSGLFLVDLIVKKGNSIKILIDKQEGINIEDCTRVSRLLDAKLDRDIEDFELEVSSPGLGAPLKVFRQYQKNLGNEVDVIKKDGMKVSGRLTHVDDDGILLEIGEKANKSRRKNKEDKSKYFFFSDIKSTKIKINF